MGFPWFTARKNSPPTSPRQSSEGLNNLSSRSRPGKSFSGNKMSARERQSFSTGSDSATRHNWPLPSAAEIESVFNKFDANGDGKISPSELGNMMRSLGYDGTEDEVRLRMAEADLDGDGCMDLSEFVAVNTQGVDSATRLQDLKNAFKMFDMDGNGSISAHELHCVLTRLGESFSLDECRIMIRGADADGDGQVSFGEFLAMMSTPVAGKS